MTCPPVSLGAFYQHPQNDFERKNMSWMLLCNWKSTQSEHIWGDLKKYGEANPRHRARGYYFKGTCYTRCGCRLRFGINIHMVKKILE